MSNRTSFCLLLVLVVLSACAPPPEPEATTPAEGSFPELTGAYLGQTPPGTQPELFAPGIVTTGLFTRDIAMTPDGSEIYFTVGVGARFDFAAILGTRLADGRWTEPEVTDFGGTPQYQNLEPFVAPDGSRLFFVSNRPRDGVEGEAIDHDIWVVDREGESWGEPYNLGGPVNTDAPEFFPSVTRDGTLYFTRENPEDRSNTIMRSRQVDGAYTEPEALPTEVNTGPARFNASIAPDESYILLPIFGREDSLGGTDYYVSFRDERDRWTGPVHLGEPVSSESAHEYSAYVSPDGQYLFFMSSRHRSLDDLGPRFTYDSLHGLHTMPGNGNADIYWVEASLLTALRAEAGAS